MSTLQSLKSDQRGATLVEFSIAATVFLMAMFAVIEFGRVLWVHNALTDAARRGARYAVLQCAPSDATCPGSSTAVDRIKNIVVYGNSAGGTQPLVENLTTSNVNVNYSAFGLDGGTVSVSITNYQFRLVVPLIGTTIPMPSYRTTLTGESAGWIPSNL